MEEVKMSVLPAMRRSFRRAKRSRNLSARATRT
jgi:hypothetical protein